MDRERTTRWEDPMRSAAALGAMPGLEMLQRLRDGTLPGPPIASTLGFALEEVEEGRAVFAIEPGEHLYNPIGSVHGGVYAAVLDSAAACALHSTLPAGVGYTSLDLSVRFLRAMTADSGRAVCEGRVVHRGRRVALTEASLVDGRGRLLATATSSCLVFELPAPPPGPVADG